MSPSSERVLTEAADSPEGPAGGTAGARSRALMEERRKLERELDRRPQAPLALGGGAGSASNGAGTKDVNGIKLATRILEGVPAKELKGMADDAQEADRLRRHRYRRHP